MLKDVDFYVVNFAKWMLTGLNGTMFWVKDRHEYISTFVAEEQEYLRQLNVDGYEMTNYKDWHVGQGHRFAAVRLWYVIRRYGVEGLKENIRNLVALARYFEQFVRSDSRFQIVGQVRSALVCLRYFDPEMKLADLNALNKRLLENIEEDTSFGHVVSSNTCGNYFLRFVVNCHTALKEDVESFWNHAKKCLDILLNEVKE